MLKESLLREIARYDTVKAAIADPSTPEGGIAQRAYERLRAILGELSLDSAGELLQMACQAAEILLMMREEDEAPSDFQVGAPSPLARGALLCSAWAQILSLHYVEFLSSLEVCKLSVPRNAVVAIRILSRNGAASPGANAADPPHFMSLSTTPHAYFFM